MMAVAILMGVRAARRQDRRLSPVGGPRGSYLVRPEGLVSFAVGGVILSAGLAALVAGQLAGAAPLWVGVTLNRMPYMVLISRSRTNRQASHSNPFDNHRPI